MTREEAEIYAKTMTYEDALYNLSQARAIPYRKATFIKVNELIQALSQEPCETSTDELMTMVYPTIFCDDAVSREAVLKIIDGWYENNRNNENIEDLIILITYMSSFTQKSAKDYLDMADEKAKKIKDALIVNPQPCDDAISREDAIDKIQHAEINFTITSNVYFSEYKKEIQEIIDHIVEAQTNAIKQLPSVTQKSKTGDDWRKGFLAGMNHCLEIIKEESRQKGGKE